MTAPTFADALAFARRVVADLDVIAPRSSAIVSVTACAGGPDEDHVWPVQFCAAFRRDDSFAKSQAVLRLLLPESAIPLRNETPQLQDAQAHGKTADGIPWVVIVPMKTFYAVCPPSPEEADARDADKAQQAEQELAARRAEAKAYNAEKGRA